MMGLLDMLPPPKEIVMKQPQNYGINRRPVKQSMIPTGLLDTGKLDSLWDYVKSQFQEKPLKWSQERQDYHNPLVGLKDHATGKKKRFKTKEERIKYYKDPIGKGSDYLDQLDTVKGRRLKGDVENWMDELKRDHNLEVRLLETFRTPEKQLEHWQKGRNSRGEIVGTVRTHSKGDTPENLSKHQKYEAFDFNFFPLTEDPKSYRIAIDAAKKYGLVADESFELGHLYYPDVTE